MNPDPHRTLSASPSNYLRSHTLYVDCATPQTSLITMARDLFGEEHLLFGSDFPYIRSSLRDLRVAIELIEQVSLSNQGKTRLTFDQRYDSTLAPQARVAIIPYMHQAIPVLVVNPETVQQYLLQRCRTISNFSLSLP